MSGKRVLILIVIMGVGLIAALVVLLPRLGVSRVIGHWTLTELNLRGIATAVDFYATNSGGRYPDGYGVLIWEGHISPEMLFSPTDPRDGAIATELDAYDWSFDDNDPPLEEMSEYAAEQSSFIVLVWGIQRAQGDDRMIAYQRLDADQDYVLVAYGPNHTEWVPRDQAVREIRAAGHEPVWADEPED